MFWYIVVVYFISITTLVVFMHNQNKQTELLKIQSHLTFGARTAEQVLPQDYLKRATRADAISQEEYRAITARLTNVALSGDYAYLYVLKNIQGKYYFIASSVTSDEMGREELNPYWLPYQQVPEALLLAYKTIKPQFGTYSDEWGRFYSCFIPVVDEVGNEFILGADINLDDFEAIMKKNAVWHLFQLLALLLIMVPISFLIFRIQSVFSRELETNTAIMDSAITCILVVSDCGKILSINQSALNALGKTREQIIAHNVSEPEFRNNPIFERLALCIKTGERFQGEFPRKDIDGNTVWEYIVIDFIPHKQTQAPIFYVFCQNVSELKSVQSRLQQSNVILNYLTQASHKLLSNPDPLSVIPDVIENLGRSLGKRMVQVLHKEESTWKTLSIWQSDGIDVVAKSKLTKHHPKPEFIHWEEKLARGKVLHANSRDFPKEFLNIIGVHADRSISLYPINIDNAFWGFIVTMRSNQKTEISEEIITNSFVSFSDSIGTAIKRAEMEKQLRTATEAKTNFLSSMSHEIRTPLNGILGMVSLLSNTSLDKEQSDYLLAMKSAGNQLYSLIGDVLDVSRIEAGKFNLRRTPMSLQSTINNVKSIVQFQLSEKQITLIPELSKNIPDIIISDEMRLKQILVNLINNAIKFTESGYIKICVDLIDENTLRFDIIDTGAGMSPEKIKSIFEPFYQGEDEQHKHRGSGLGLMITKRLINMMQGDITVTSVPGKGSTFSFFIKVGIIQDKLV